MSSAITRIRALEILDSRGNPTLEVEIQTASGHRGRAAVPGDKSISHRSLMLGALTIGETEIAGLLEAEDILATAAAMRSFGATVERGSDGIWRVGRSADRAYLAACRSPARALLTERVLDSLTNVLHHRPRSARQCSLGA